MKYIVSGHAFVPVKVILEIEATRPDMAMHRANNLLKQGVQKYIQSGSEDYGAAWGFDATDAILPIPSKERAERK